uniref:Retinoic acid early transcript 1E n=1 Tax=Papio anubis TaxID=9555 RepID=A0A8I5NJQ7_PAPAN
MNPPVNTINTKYTPRVLGTIKYLTPDSQGEMGAGIRKVERVWDGTAPSASLAWSREIWVTEARVLIGLFPCPGPHLHLSLTDAHSLCFNFSIKSWSRPGQPWCEAQVFMNKNLFLQYDSDSNMVKPLGLLGKKVNATSTWGELTQTLGEVGRDLRMLLLDIKPQIKTSGPSTLQVEMFCQREAERCTGASWQFTINGEKSLLLDAMNMTWTVINHEARKIKETWKKDRGLEKYFRKLSVGDCDHWLREFSEQWEAMPEPTVSPVNVSDVHGSSSSLLDTWIILGAFILFVLMGIFLIYIRWQKGEWQAGLWPLKMS